MIKPVYLLPVGAGRHELYAESSADDSAPPEIHSRGFFRRHLMRAGERWHHLVHEAAEREAAGSSGWFVRWWDRAVCGIAENIAEQRTLWALRDVTRAVLVHAPTLDAASAATLRDASLVDRRRHHRRWLMIDGLAFIVSGALVVVPGPNIVAYYFAFRTVGHWLSRRGASRGLAKIEWTTRSEPVLTELDRLTSLPRGTREPMVEAIARALNLPHLPAFFDRACAPARQ